MALQGKEENMVAEARMEAGQLEPLNEKAQVVTEGSNRVMKVVSLMLLTPHYAVLILLMRFVRTRPGPKFFTSTTVLLSEVTKTVTCLGIILVQQKGISGWWQHLHEFLFSRPRDFLKVCLPSLLFVLQNNLVFVALSNLDAATFQVTYQLKILTTALFSVLMLGKRLSVVQWLALLMLFAGVSVIQVKLAMESQAHSSPNTATSPSSQPLANTHNAEPFPPKLITQSPANTAAAAAQPASMDTPEQNYFTGLIAVLACCCLSGFANVFFEMLLKGGKQSVWVRNVQLGTSGAVLSALTCLLHDGRALRDKGFLYGYDNLVWTVIGLQSIGGLLVAAVIKYADNILKGFSTAGSILLSCLASIYIFDFHMDSVFIGGTTLVLVSLYLYNLFPAVQPASETKTLQVPLMVKVKPAAADSNSNSTDR